MFSTLPQQLNRTEASLLRAQHQSHSMEITLTFIFWLMAGHSNNP
jgi:hypothetical protein